MTTTLTRFGVTFKAMGGVCEVQLFAADNAAAHALFMKVVEEVRRIEKKYSRFLKESVTSCINASAGKAAIELDSETAKLVSFADACYLDSRGFFDLTSGVLQHLWDFRSESIPSTEAVAHVVPLVGWNKVEWCPPALRLPIEGMSLDFGGIGKEYAVDQASELLLLSGVTSGFVNFAGDVRVLGPRPDGTPWSIGIVDPRNTKETLRHIKLNQGALATSGDYERFMIVDGKRYCHILDPHTGFPRDEVWSVSVLADSCLVAGALSTVGMLMGFDEGEKLLQAAKVKYLMMGEGVARGDL